MKSNAKLNNNTKLNTKLNLTILPFLDLSNIYNFCVKLFNND